jgi:hypothetical protein
VKVESLQAEGGGLKANRNRPKVEETRCILGFYCHLNREEKLTVSIYGEIVVVVEVRMLIFKKNQPK